MIRFRKLRLVGLLAGAAIVATVADSSAADRMRFWNLTTVTIQELYLAPAGTTSWGPNQCKNDRDGTVDADERLTITGVTPGRYDVRLKDKKGRVCTVRNVEVVGGKPYAFSIADKDLTECQP
ncbi:MAG TPA: hypothetical protein VMC10_13210 [Stellaceae bacterium]|nr:hypothetical protein [Stellaceae bacterium]